MRQQELFESSVIKNIAKTASKITSDGNKIGRLSSGLNMLRFFLSLEKGAIGVTCSGNCKKQAPAGSSQDVR